MFKIKLLNCGKNKSTSIDTITHFGRSPECFIFRLQEPWCEPKGQPQTHPDFDIFTPILTKSKCVTYIRRTPLITVSVNFIPFSQQQYQ
jgi:hypothetical protein